MKGIKEVVIASNIGRTPIYYNPSTDTVYLKAGKGRFYLTDLLIPHTEDEVIKTVKKFMYI